MFTQIISDIFSSPLSAPELSLIEKLRKTFPGSQHVSTVQISQASFPLLQYLESIGVKVNIIEEESYCDLRYDITTQLSSRNILSGVTAFTYDSISFRAYQARWRNEARPYALYHLVFDAPDESAGKNLSDAVFTWANSLREEIWVFEGGQWSKSKELYKSIKSSNWDSIVLEESFKERLRTDTKTYFSSKHIYYSLDITWKRGILLLGPSGNGKTETVKALINELGATALYVKSFSTRAEPEHGVRSIFDHARKHAPCILVLEDLDAMVGPDVRSFFLNEMDGLAQNEGLLTIATTNHPEYIDDAILNRPSRFDVTYDFGLPNYALRKLFAIKWIQKVQSLGGSIGITFSDPDKTAGQVAELTDDWSFAFLKELFISFMLRVAHDQSLRSAGVEVKSEESESTLLKQVEQLAKQIIRMEHNESSGSQPRRQFAPPPPRAQGAAAVPHVFVD